MFEVYLHMSTAFVNCDKTGHVEEKMYKSSVNWEAQYNKIHNGQSHNIRQMTPQVLGDYPDTFVYTKRMAENLLVSNNNKNIPLVILRPGIVGAASENPLPGWTDSARML